VVGVTKLYIRFYTVLEFRIGLGTTDNGGDRNNSKIIKGEEEERNITIEGQIPPN
jgi:hypothetical protein